jgi:hypothetical protein
MALNRRPSDVKTAVIAATNLAYAAGQQIGVPVEIKNAVEDSGSSGTVESISILDPAKQDAAVDILFFSQQPSTGADKAAWAPTAADLALLLGVVKVSATTPYADGAARSVGSIGNIGLKIKAEKAAPAQSNTSIWVLVVSRGTPNYGASAPTLTIRVGIDRD